MPDSSIADEICAVSELSGIEMSESPSHGKTDIIHMMTIIVTGFCRYKYCSVGVRIIIDLKNCVKYTKNNHYCLSVFL